MNLFRLSVLLLLVSHSHISFLMEAPVKDQVKVENVDKCPICQEIIESQDTTSVCANRHPLHSTCAIETMSHQVAEAKPVTCPLCRADCEEQWVESLLRPQIPDLIKKIKEKIRSRNNELVLLQQENALLRSANYGGADILALQNEQINRQLDNRFMGIVVEHIKKRTALEGWRNGEQKRLEGFHHGWWKFSMISAVANYVSPFWTGFIANDTKDLKDRLQGVRYWGTLRTIFTSLPCYMLGKLYLDYQRYKINLQEIEKRTTLAHDWGFQLLENELSNFKKKYEKRVKINQLVLPLIFTGMGMVSPFVFEGWNKINGNSVDILAAIKLSMGGGFAVGYCSQRSSAQENQEWFEKNKPRFGTLQSTFRVGENIISRRYEFDADVPQ